MNSVNCFSEGFRRKSETRVCNFHPRGENSIRRTSSGQSRQLRLATAFVLVIFALSAYHKYKTSEVARNVMEWVSDQYSENLSALRHRSAIQVLVGCILHDLK